MTENKKMGENP